MTKPNVVSEAPPGVARNAGVEGVDGRSPASKRQSRARERKCLATGPASATGEGVRGTCATSPGAIRRPKARRSLPSGHPACSCAQKLLSSGHLACSCCNAKSNIKLTCDWKAEMNLRTPRWPTDIMGIVPTDFHGLARKARKLLGLSGNKPPVIFFVVF